MTKRATQWFEVDKDGLGALRENADPASLLYELAQNVWDEDGATRCDITITPSARGHYTVVVTDNAPGGFRDLRDAYRLFAPSYKREHAEKRGRFNLGEKLVLALCESASIETTSGSVLFMSDGSRVENASKCRAVGTVVTAVLRVNAKQVQQMLVGFRRVLPPSTVATTLNGEPVPYVEPTLRVEVKALPTVLMGEEGWRGTERSTVLALYDAAAFKDSQAWLYEMGIPIVPIDGRWSVNVGQKVPLNMDRDNVTPAYLRRIYVEVANATADRMTSDDATATWTKEALADERTAPEAVRAIVTQRYGDRAVAYDPSDPEGSKRAVAAGYTVVYPRMLSRDEWSQVRTATPDLLRPAGQVTPSNSKIEFSPDGRPPLPREKWSPGMVQVMLYAEAVATVLHVPLDRVSMHSDPTSAWGAAYGDGHLSFNYGRLGKAWFDRLDERRVLALLFHEFAHARAGDHLSEEYHEAICDLAAAAVLHDARFPRLDDTAYALSNGKVLA